MSILTRPAKELFEKNVLNNKLHKKVSKELLSEWNIPLSITNDLLTLRKSSSEVSDYILYHVICAIDDNALPKNYPPKNLVDSLRKKYSNEEIVFPLEFPAIQIDDDQWVSKISAKELFKFGNNTLINYNENAQRVMRSINLPSGEYFEIKLNEKAVSAIEESFSENRYIPNTITLNIPYNDKSSFYYDEKNQKLVVKKIEMFDILDGYHRYVAINRICALNDQFDYVMELRITNFQDEKAKQFIWQEDQKTKMSKVESDSLNKYNPANMIVKKIDSSVYGNVISYNKGNISSSTLSQAISIIYEINPNKNYKISETNAIGQEIIEGFDAMSEENPKIFDSKLSSIQIYCLICMIKNKVFDANVFEKFCKNVEKAELFDGRNIRHSSFKKMEAILKEMS